LKAHEWFSQRLEEYREDSEFILEELVLDVTEQICAAMAEQDIPRSELAQRLGVSRAYVTKLLNGHGNMTLRTLVEVAHALGGAMNVSMSVRPQRFQIATPRAPREYAHEYRDVWHGPRGRRDLIPQLAEDAADALRNAA